MRIWSLALIMTVALATPGWAGTTLTGDLKRGAELGFALQQERALTAMRLDPASPVAQAGLRDGDRVVAVGGRRFAKPHEGAALLQRLKGGEPASLIVARDGGTERIDFVPRPRPLESLPELDIEYGVVRTSDGTRLRTIISRPAGATSPLPAIFIAQWVSCGTIEMNPRGSRLLRGLATRSGLAMIRVERAGAGDSEGPACHELDYDTEVRHYREALDVLARHRWVDSDRILIHGISLGSTTAPLIAQGRKVAGLIVQGGGAVTHVERMIGFDRQNLERTGAPLAEIHERMLKNIEFHTEYLLRAKSPERIARERPHLADVWGRLLGTGDGVHYGRPYAYHQQAARHDFLEAWSRIEAPVLVVYGEYDQFETRHGHRLIVDAINRLRPGTATFLEIANASHDLDLFANAEEAYRDENGVAAPELFLQPVLAWLKQVTGK